MSSTAISRGDAAVIERTFEAGVELIWQMWTDPNRFKNLILANELSYGNLFGVNILHIIRILSVGVTDIWLGLALVTGQTNEGVTASMQVQVGK